MAIASKSTFISCADCKILSFPENYSVNNSLWLLWYGWFFGYEKSIMIYLWKIGELVLFPAVRSQTNDTIIAAREQVAGTR